MNAQESTMDREEAEAQVAPLKTKLEEIRDVGPAPKWSPLEGAQARAEQARQSSRLTEAHVEVLQNYLATFEEDQGRLEELELELDELSLDYENALDATLQADEKVKALEAELAEYRRVGDLFGIRRDADKPVKEVNLNRLRAVLSGSVDLESVPAWQARQIAQELAVYLNTDATDKILGLQATLTWGRLQDVLLVAKLGQWLGAKLHELSLTHSAELDEEVHRWTWLWSLGLDNAQEVRQALRTRKGRRQLVRAAKVKEVARG